MKSGLRRLFRIPYENTIRPLLPSKISVHNGIAVRDQVKLLDIKDAFPTYEDEIVSALRDNVRTGNYVVIVGGGLGVSTVVAAQQVGREGSVTIYEGSESQLHRVQNTVQLNEMVNRVEVEHAIVGTFFEDSINRYGKPSGAESVSPGELPKCDVLELDCEGAEIEILEHLDIRPSTLIVESHAFLDSPADLVREKITGLNYEITEEMVEDEEKGIYIFVAKKTE